MKIAIKQLAILATRLGLCKPQPKSVDSILQAFTTVVKDLEEVEHAQALKVQQHVQAEVDAKKAYDEAVAIAQAGQEAAAKEAERAHRATARFLALAGV